jgi:hypothetical protein
VTKDQREVFVYNFERKEKQQVLSFTRRDGLVSHMKMIYGEEGEWLFYVRNTKDVIKYDVRKKTATLVGSCRDSVLSLVII